MNNNNIMSSTVVEQNNTTSQQQSQQPSSNTVDLDEIRSVQIDNEIFEIPKRYRLVELRGQGSYGVVCSARDMSVTTHKQLVAIKKNRNVFPRTIAPQQPFQGKGSSQELDHQLPRIKHESKNPSQKKLPHRSKLSQKRILRELKILTHLRNHPNIIQLHDVIQPRSYEAFGDVYFVTDLMEADLRDILESNQTLTDQHIQYFMYQLLLAVHYSQSANILHRDLKPENILLNSNCELKICDFGLARGIDFEFDPRMSTNYVQTRWYRAPELLLNNPTISKQTDMWSIGCILGELLGRRVLFKGSCPVDQMKKIINTVGTPKTDDIRGSDEGIKFVMELPFAKSKDFAAMFPDANSNAIDLLKQMLVFNHENRITTDAALKHPYFKDLYDERDIRVCEKEFDFSFEEHLDDDADALKRCAFETIMTFRKQVDELKEPAQSQQIPRSVSADHEEMKRRQQEQEELKRKQEEEERVKRLEEEQRKKKEDKRKKKESRSRFDIFRRARNVFLMN